MSHETTINLKAVIVGDARVGKSALFRRILFNDFSEEYESTIGIEFGNKMFSNSKTKVCLEIWDTAGKEKFRVITNNFYRNMAILCIVIDATNKLTGEKSKVAQISKYLKQLENVNLAVKPMILVIENKSDLPNASQLTDGEFAAIQALGIDRHNYIYISTKLDQVSNKKNIIDCFAGFIQTCLAGRDQAFPHGALLQADNAVISQCAPPTMFSIAWWKSLFSSTTAATIRFERADEVREQIDRFSNEEAIRILHTIHKYLVKGSANNQRLWPYELTFGGGSKYVAFMDRVSHKVIECVYDHSYPQNVTRWLRICLPYVFYRNSMPEVYMYNAKHDLLILFNDVLKTASCAQSSWLRYPSTSEFYKSLPTFFHPECVPESKPQINNSLSMVRPTN
jgi:small GTP-binding protein